MSIRILSSLKRLFRCGRPTPFKLPRQRTLLRVEELEGRQLPSGLVSSALQPPAAPVFTATAVSASEIDLAWNSVSGASSYPIAEWTGSSWTTIGTVGGSSTSCAVTGLSPNSTAYFLVGAANSAGVTWAADYQSATTFPATPSFTTSTVSATEIDLAWTAVSGGPNSYLIQQWSNGAWTQIASVPAGATSYAVTGLNANGTYYFRVGAGYNTGTSWAPYQSATTFAAIPVFTATAASPSEIDLTWTGVTGGANSYVIEEEINGAWTQIASVNGSGSSYAVTGLNANTTYNFQVGAANSAGTAMANPQSAMTFASAPSLTADTASASEIDLSWSNVNGGASNYVIEEAMNGGWTTIATLSGSSTHYAVTGLNGNTTYHFRVGAANDTGTNWSSSQSATTDLSAEQLCLLMLECWWIGHYQPPATQSSSVPLSSGNYQSGGDFMQLLNADSISTNTELALAQESQNAQSTGYHQTNEGYYLSALDGASSAWGHE